MKKLLFLFIPFFLLTGCNDKEDNEYYKILTRHTWECKTEITSEDFYYYAEWKDVRFLSNRSSVVATIVETLNGKTEIAEDFHLWHYWFIEDEYFKFYDESGDKLLNSYKIIEISDSKFVIDLYGNLIMEFYPVD